jgi:hypothetical protein
MESTDTIPPEHPQPERAALELLQAENASLRAELQALRKSKEQQPPHPDPAGTFNLFGLPRELRDAIYEMCLVPGIVFIKRRPQVARIPKSDMRYQRQLSGPKAASQLFLVNKKLRLESLAVFLSKNQFIVTGPRDMEAMYWNPVLAGKNWCGHINHRDSLVIRHLRSISMSLNSIENAPTAIMNRYEGIDEAKFRQYSEWEYVDTNTHSRSHNYIANVLQNRFVCDLYLLFVRPGQLRRIEINLEATACASGCHRLVKSVLSVFQDKQRRVLTKPHVDLLESVDFIGLVNEEEVRSVHRAFGDSMGGRFTCHVHELPEGYPVDAEVDDEQG